MNRRIVQANLVAFGLVVVGACAPDDPGAALTAAATASDAASTLTTAAAALDGIDARADLVESRGRDVLQGAHVDVPEHSDALRTLTVAWQRDGAAVDAPWGVAPVADARLVADGAVVWLSADGVVHESTLGGETVELAHDANGPLGVSPSGRYVTWTGGDAPEVDVRRLDRATGAIDAMAPASVPAWSPVPLDDGRVHFVTVHASLPQRAVATAPGAVTRLTSWADLDAVGAFATGPGAPQVFGDAVVARAGDRIVAWSVEAEPTGAGAGDDAGADGAMWTAAGDRVATWDGDLLVRTEQGWTRVDPETGVAR